MASKYRMPTEAGEGEEGEEQTAESMKRQGGLRLITPL
jgi:hypothetical protein